MFNLRLTQLADGDAQLRFEIVFEGDGRARQTAISHFTFALSGQDQEDLRWYLEDYLKYPLDPAPKIAARIEERMAALGAELFNRIFDASDDVRRLWTNVRPELSDTRVEIASSVREATSIPWELMRDPRTDTPLALRARAFVRASQQAEQPARLPQTGSGPIRILLVICRPEMGDNVPFRSVAIRLLKGLGGAASQALQLAVLRPPTFEQLSRVLRAAKAQGEPYHVVHFDGHGGYGEGGPRPGAHGYLMFENPALNKNYEPIDGPRLGSLLVETQVPFLILNACRSAHSEPPPAPLAVAGAANPYAQVRAFGSLAQEIMDAGVAGVVAMRYNVFVETAAMFMADAYGALVEGQALGEAVSFARKQLAAQPLRSIAFDPVHLEDWPVPVVYEAAPVALFPKRLGAQLKITLGKGEAPGRRALDERLPAPPDVGFFGRDETLHKLDRAFQSQAVVLLHAYAGSGKTTTAAEFARWYSLTGGVEGPVIFSSFEQYKPLARVLDAFGHVFDKALEREGVHWLALSDPERREVALEVMCQTPVFWIWDNVEPVAGFPTGAPSRWSAEEQQELADFLRAARETKAKFLVTSRRDEHGWLGDLPARITVPPMPFQESVQLAQALAEKLGRRLNDLEDWRPLLEFTQGNPMTITVLAGQVLREGIRSREQIKDFVARLRGGEDVFKDEASEGRTRSLAASLDYGFANAFSEPERKQLALLHLFQGFVDVNVLRWMGVLDTDWRLPEVRGLTRERGIALLDRAAEVGLLTARGGGRYSIHPALPWFFKKLFDDYYAGSESLAAIRGFVGAVSAQGDYDHQEYNEGKREVIAALAAEEANLLQARDLARKHAWSIDIVGTMQGLQVLYDHQGRRIEWARLVEEIVPDFIDPVTDGLRAGLKADWAIINGYRAQIARAALKWTEAERLQRAQVDWARQAASAALARRPEEWDSAQRGSIHVLSFSVHELGQIQRETGRPECVASYAQAYELDLSLNLAPRAAIAARNLGNAYGDLPAIRDLDKAEHWYQRSLELCPEKDWLGRARCLGQLGGVAYKRFEDARKADKPAAEAFLPLSRALDLYLAVLDLLPEDAATDLAVTHNQLGAVYMDLGDFEQALRHFSQSIDYREAGGDLYGAALTRRNVALALTRRGRFADAEVYAAAALRGFNAYGGGANKEVLNTLTLIAQIKKRLKASDE